MTQPSERRRALRWGRDTLAAIMADPGVPPGMRQEAEATVAAYPDDRSIATCFLEVDDLQLEQHLSVLLKTHELLKQGSSCPSLSRETRMEARATDRHFPQCAELARGNLAITKPRQWVAFHLLRDMDTASLHAELQGLGIADPDRACAKLEAMRSRG